MSAPDHAAFEFQYVLEGHGWATAVLLVGRSRVEMTSSDVHDPIRESLLALSNLRSGFSKVQIMFADEPGEHLLEIVPLSTETLSIELSWFDDWNSQDPEADRKFILAAKVSRSGFEATILGTVGELRKKWGLKGYKRQWYFGFPSKEYDKLVREIG